MVRSENLNVIPDPVACPILRYIHVACWFRFVSFVTPLSFRQFRFVCTRRRERSRCIYLRRDHYVYSFRSDPQCMCVQKYFFIHIKHHASNISQSVEGRMASPLNTDSYSAEHIVASELKDPICHSDECQIGSFSSEATIS